MTLESYILDAIEGKPITPLAKVFFSFLSFLFRAAVALRHRAYDAGLFKTHRASLPVVSVGNIVAGGTGKTPLIRLVAQELQGRGKVAILTRGYKSKLRGEPQIINSLDPEKFGDEPIWLKHQLPEAAIWVGKDRVRSSLLAANDGARVLLLDDGMQHRALSRQVEIVLLDGEDLFGRGAFLPRGYLRDFPSRLKAADLIVTSHVYDGAQAEKCRAEIARYSAAPVASICYRFKDEPFLRGKKIGVFCALGRPERFFQMLGLAGCEAVDTIVALDHTPFDARQLEAFAVRCKAKGAEFLVCTEKDGVKLPHSLDLALPVKSLAIEIEWIDGKRHWQECIETIKSLMGE